MAYALDFLNTIDDCRKPADNLKKEDFFSKVKNDFPDVSERSRNYSEGFDTKNGEEFPNLYLKSTVCL